MPPGSKIFKPLQNPKIEEFVDSMFRRLKAKGGKPIDNVTANQRNLSFRWLSFII